MNESCLRVYLYPLALYSQWDTHTHTHTHTHTPTRLTVHLLCNCHEWVMSHSIFQLRLSCMSHVSQHTSFHSHYIHNETRLIYVWLSAYQHCDCHARVPSHRRPLSTLTVSHLDTTRGISPLWLTWMSHVSQYISITTVMHESRLTAYLYSLSLYSQWDTVRYCHVNAVNANESHSTFQWKYTVRRCQWISHI